MPFVSLLISLGAVSMAIAAASYYLVERPILRFKDRRRPPPAPATEAPAADCSPCQRGLSALRARARAATRPDRGRAAPARARPSR